MIQIGNKIFAGIILLVSWSFAQDSVDEDDLFSDTESMIDSASIVSGKLNSNVESTTVEFSGEISSVAAVNADRRLLDGYRSDLVRGDVYMSGNFLLDIRLPYFIKSFGNVEVRFPAGSSNPMAGGLAGSDTLVWIRELFIDLNVNRVVYLRTGKQVLKWGRSFFWNPTDLVNVERKSFIEKIGAREGTMGIKGHVPFGTLANMYGFVDLNRPGAVDSLAAAIKAEFLIGGVETAISTWAKPHRSPVLGFDISGPLLDFTFSGELSLAKGNSYPSIVAFSTADTGKWVPRISAGALGFFDLMDVKDRVSLGVEFYYNQAGHDGNAFKDFAEYLAKFTDKSLADVLQDTSLTGIVGGMTSGGDGSGQNQSVINFYEPNSYSKYYAALFTSINKFIISDLTLSVNAIANLQHWCAMISAGLGYANNHNLSLNVTLTGFVGPENTEYTFLDQAAILQLSASVAF